METNHKKGKSRKAHHLKNHRKPDDSKNFVPKPPKKEENDEKPILFQLGSIASYRVNDVRFEADPDISTSTSATHSLSSFSLSSSGDILEPSAKERKSNLSFDSSQHNKEDSGQHNKELFSLPNKLCKLQGSSDTLGSQVSDVTHASVEPALLSPSVQMMDREGSDQPQRNSVPTLERNLSTTSNDSLFSLSIGDNARDELFDYRDFKAVEPLISGELLSFCPSLHIPADSSVLGKSFDIEETVSGDSEDKSSNSNVSWRNLGDDEAPSSTQSFSYPITKKKKKKKAAKKMTQPQQQQQQKHKRCCWLCCKNNGPCFACCKWLSCNSNFSCCKRLKGCTCCCKRPKCFLCFSCCKWPKCGSCFSCCKWPKCGSCFSCCKWPKCGSCFSCCKWPKCGSCFSCCKWPKCGSCFSCCKWPKCGSCFSCCKCPKCGSCFSCCRGPKCGSCFSCCKWPKCGSCFSCCRGPKCGSCLSCCRWPSFHHKSCCSWLLCFHWSCWSCCSSCSKKVVDDEMTRGTEEQKMKKAESKTSLKWFCCFPYCSS